MAPNCTIIGIGSIGCAAHAYYHTTLSTAIPDPSEPTSTDTHIEPVFTFTYAILPDPPKVRPKQYQNFKYNLIHYKIKDVQRGYITKPSRKMLRLYV